MPPENISLVVYEKLYGFLQTLNYCPARDQAAIAKLLEMYQTNPAKTLALLNTLLYSKATGENPDRLNSNLTATLQAESVEIPVTHYSLSHYSLSHYSLSHYSLSHYSLSHYSLSHYSL